MTLTPDGIALTGVSIPPYVIPVAIVVVIVGIALLVINAILRRRRNRADASSPTQAGPAEASTDEP